MDVQKAIQSESEWEDVVKTLKKNIATAVETAPALEGVRPVENAGGHYCYTVSFSTIARQPSLNLSAKYYSQRSQADMVKSAISSCTRVKDVVLKVQKMIDEKQVVIGKERIALNQNTIAALQKAIES